MKYLIILDPLLLNLSPTFVNQHKVCVSDIAQTEKNVTHLAATSMSEQNMQVFRHTYKHIGILASPCISVVFVFILSPHHFMLFSIQHVIL